MASNNTSGDPATLTGQWYQLMDCPYRVNCVDNGVKCASCAHNPKRSYWEPVPYYPTYPYYPYPWTAPIITYGPTVPMCSHYSTN
jgi:hypothetical protein